MAKAQNTVTKTAMWWLDRLDKKELAKLQAKETQDQPLPDEEHEPTPLEKFIDDYLMRQRFIATAYELRKDVDGEKLNVDEFHNFSMAERCEKAVAEYGDRR